MRVIWLVGDHPAAKQKLERALALDRTGVQYVVRVAHTLSKIPMEHLNDSGVTALLDAFHPEHPGFEGLKRIRETGFQGPVFLFGEPSPDHSVTPFRSEGLNGYFPSFDRADYQFVAGVLHHQLHFEGELNLSLFLQGSGRSAVEIIKTFRDFNAFAVKLANFVGRFGVDINQLRKVLMGLSLGHVKAGPGAPVVDQPFAIHYGMDPQKVLLAASTFSRGATRAAVLNEFCEVLSGLKNQKSLPGTIFPELFHVGRAAENMVLFSGSAKAETETMDPMLMLTGLAFPSSQEKRQAPLGVFGFTHVTQTAERSEEDEARLFAAEDAAPPSRPDPLDSLEEDATPLLADEVPEEATAEPKGPAGMIGEVDLTDILGDINVVGDKPVEVSADARPRPPALKPAAPPPASEPQSLTATAPVPPSELTAVAATPYVPDGPLPTDVQELQRRLVAAEAEVHRLREVSNAMGQDIRRLMKERRQPTTDRELRDAVEQLEEKLKKSNQDRSLVQSEIAKRDETIQALKNENNNLRRNRNAA